MLKVRLNHQIKAPSLRVISEDGKQIVYSHTKGGLPYMDDSYIANIDGSNIINLTNSPATWEEHANFKPEAKSFAFISSRADVSWKAPSSKVDTLKTELYFQDEKGVVRQLTNFNETGDAGIRYLVSDFDWDKEGKRIVFQATPVNVKTGSAGSPSVWILMLNK